MKLKNKMILIYFFTIIIPLITVGEIVITVSGNKIIEQSILSNQESSRQVCKNIKGLLDQHLIVSDRIRSDDMLLTFLNPLRNYEVLDSINAYNDYLRPIVKNSINVQNSNSILKIYYLNDTLLSDSDNYIFADTEIQEKEFYKKAVNGKGLISWTYNRDYIYLSRSLEDINSNTLIGVVVVGVPERHIFNLVEEYKKASKLIMVTDNNGYIISSNDRSYIGKSLKTEKYFSTISSRTSGILDYTDMIHYKIIFDSLDNGKKYPDWKIVTLVSVDELIADEVIVRNIGILVCLTSLAISSIIFSFFLSRITGRMKTLVTKMQSVKNGDFSSVKLEKSNDEIGIITDNYNLMVKSLKHLIQENYEANLNIKDITIKKREAELYALESQINPHFLFNTLESIRMNLVDEEEHEIAEVVKNLANTMRRSLDYKGDIILLSDEIEYTKSYLSIQKYRFKDKINYEINISEDILILKILKLTIQPMVENAVRHGLECKRGTGMIFIEANVIKGRLIITVKDNGAGINNEKLMHIHEEIRTTSEVKKRGSIGIKNVSDRIKLHFGNDFGLDISSEINNGTCVKMVFPVIDE